MEAPRTIVPGPCLKVFDASDAAVPGQVRRSRRFMVGGIIYRMVYLESGSADRPGPPALACGEQDGDGEFFLVPVEG